MRFVYPAQLDNTSDDEVVVSFRDIPECLTSGLDETDALTGAEDALEEAIARRINDGEPIPTPSLRRAGELDVVVPTDIAAKAALTLAFRASGLTRVALANELGIDEKAVRRMLDPLHGTAASRINRTLRQLGHELVVEVKVSVPRM